MTEHLGGSVQLLNDLLAYDGGDPTDLLSRAYNEIERLEHELEEAKVACIIAANPGINEALVRRSREHGERIDKAIEQGEAEIASGKPIPTLDEVVEQSGRQGGEK